MPVSTTIQLDLFSVLDAYKEGSCDNKTAYSTLGALHSVPPQEWERKTPIGEAGTLHSPLKRRVRWYQQTLRKLGLLEPVDGQRGHWRPTSLGRRTIKERHRDLEPSNPGIVQLAFSTELGMALWADCKDAFSRIDEPIHLVLTSPPYALAAPRDYGNPCREEYVDWLCACLEPIVKRMATGACLFLNVSNDIFEPRSPARSLYREKLVIALHERLGLFKMDEWVWHNKNKAPAPIQWASLRRVQTNTSWEPIYFFTNSPQECLTDNRRVLQPHSEQHLKYIAAGGAAAPNVCGDGANRLRVGAFSTPTIGSIPRNVITARHNCASQQDLRRWAKDNRVPIHSATMPLSIAEHIVKFATDIGHLVADPFAGWATTAIAAERNSRRWIITERMRAYLHAAEWRMNAMEQEID